MVTLASPLPLVCQRFHFVASRLAALPCALCVLVLPTPSVNPTAPSEGFVSASAQQDRMLKTLAPAVAPVLILGTRWQAQESGLLAFRQDLLSRRPMPFSNRTRHASVCGPKTGTATAARRCTKPWPRPWSSSTHVDVQMGLGPVASQSLLSSSPPFQGSPRTFLNSLITNLSSSGTRCNDLAFWTTFSVRMMCSSVIGALPTHGPSLIQVACRHGRVLVHHSFSKWQKLASVCFPKKTHKCSSPVVFP